MKSQETVLYHPTHVCWRVGAGRVGFSEPALCESKGEINREPVYEEVRPCGTKLVTGCSPSLSLHSPGSSAESAEQKEQGPSGLSLYKMFPLFQTELSWVMAQRDYMHIICLIAGSYCGKYCCIFYSLVCIAPEWPCNFIRTWVCALMLSFSTPSEKRSKIRSWALLSVVILWYCLLNACCAPWAILRIYLHILSLKSRLWERYNYPC